MTQDRNKVRRDLPQSLAGKSVGIVGLGQIGGSIVKRLSRYRPGLTLLGTDINTGLAGPAARHCRWCPSLEELVHGSDLLILAVHVPTILKLLPAVAASVAGRTRRSRLVVADAGTIKDPVTKAARRHRSTFDFVAMHPLAGTQHSGWDSSTASLFDRTTTFYWSELSGRGTVQVRELIRLLGSSPHRISPAEHDHFIAMTIGLPHLLAYSAQGLADDQQVPPSLRGRSWGSLTRVAASDPAMVAGFLSTNARATSTAVRQLARRLNALTNALKDPTGKNVESLLRRWRRT